MTKSRVVHLYCSWNNTVLHLTIFFHIFKIIFQRWSLFSLAFNHYSMLLLTFKCLCSAVRKYYPVFNIFSDLLLLYSLTVFNHYLMLYLTFIWCCLKLVFGVIIEQHSRLSSSNISCCPEPFFSFGCPQFCHYPLSGLSVTTFQKKIWKSTKGQFITMYLDQCFP